MRHIASLFAGIIIAPVAWLLIGAGDIGLDPHGLYDGVAGKPNSAIAMAMFAGAGLLLGLLAVTRLSPAGPVVVAVVFVTCFIVFRVLQVGYSLPTAFEAAKIPTNAAFAAGQSGMTIGFAALLAVSLLVPARWRGKNTDADRDVVDTATLAGTTITPKSTDAIDPFAPPSTLPETRSLDGDYDDRPQSPFDSPAPAYGAQVPGQRSPYADDGYGQDNYGYESEGSTAQQSRYGDSASQPSGQYSEQPGYGDGRQYR